MGYHVEIVRTSGNDVIPISETDIEVAISEDPSMRFLDGALYLNEEPVLSYSGGILWLNNPEESDLSRMVLLAESLDARVRGDELETYNSEGNFYYHPDDKSAVTKKKKIESSLITRKKRDQLKLNIGLISAFLLLVGIFHYLGWLS